MQVLDAPRARLDARRRPGPDGHDEMWEGVLHMVGTGLFHAADVLGVRPATVDGRLVTRPNGSAEV